MELKEFVSGALTQIVEGISEAQKATANSGARINPSIMGDWKEGVELGLLLSASGRRASVVEFDLAVTVSEKNGKKAGVGIMSGAVNIVGIGHKSSELRTANRIRFNVVVDFPSE